MAEHYLDFEKPVMELTSRIRELEAMQEEGRDIPEKNIDEEIQRLEVKCARISRVLYRDLTPWQKVQVARHPDRPHASDYVRSLVSDFVPLSGDRRFGDDKAMIAGLGKLNGQPVAILGIDKGRSTNERMKNNFGMPKPDGYRKAQRIMEMADRFGVPLVTFVDTPGAYPGVDAEARGQGEAIASCIETLMKINVSVVSVITGEGGSGGALAVAVADQVLMLENSVYSVISPEGCASILWREADKNTIPQAADAMGMTADKLSQMNVVDGVIKEPVGGAHRDTALTIRRVGEAITAALESFKGEENAVSRRREKFLNLTR